MFAKRLRLNRSRGPSSNARSLQTFELLEDRVTPASVSFAFIGDYGDNSAGELQVANLVKSWNPDFIATLGDNNYPSGAASTIDTNIGQYYHEYIGNYTGSFGAGSPVNRFFPSLGNHDWQTRSGSPALPAPYLNYFTLPGNERYYSYIQGPVEFFVLDSGDTTGTGSDGFEPNGYTSTSTQAQWLQAGLAASTTPWQVVYMHHPPYSSGSHGSTSVMQWPFKSWGADVVLSGHEHDYERLDIGGLPYIVNGLGGAETRTFGDTVSGSQVRFTGSVGAIRGFATDSTLQFEMVTVSGAVVDTLYLDSTYPRLGGTTYLDINANGARDASDRGLSGITIYLDLNHNSSFDGGEPTRVSDANGVYIYDNLAPGNYTIRELTLGSTAVTTPASNLTIKLESGSDQLAVDIGHRVVAPIFPTRTTGNLFSTTYADSNTAYVYNVFRALLDHDPTADEVSYHVNTLNNGYSRIAYATSIYNREEQLSFQVDQIYRTFLKRPADDAGKAFWSGQLRRGLSPEWIISLLVTADEYQSAHSSNAAYIRGLYNDLLCREPTSADIAFWTRYLGSHSRFDLAFNFATTPEAYRRAVKDVFVHYLHREASATDINHWVNLLVNRQVSLSRLAILLMASSEFGSRALNASG